jgi:hypothetical protein
MIKKAEKISKKIGDEKNEAMSLVNDGQLLEKRRVKEKDEKREAVLSSILSLYRHYFCCRVTYKRIANMAH